MQRLYSILQRLYRLLSIPHLLCASTLLTACWHVSPTYYSEVVLSLPVNNYGAMQPQQFVDDFTATYEQLRSQSPQADTLPRVRFIKEDASQSNSTAQWLQLLSQKPGVYILSSGFLYSQLKERRSNPPVQLLLQTLTHSFIFDQEAEYYRDGTSDDYLNSAAAQQYREFSRLSYATWAGANQQGGPLSWNGIRYDYFYSNKLVDFYRGMVWIRGTRQIIADIRNAWATRDWRRFRSYGFLTGSPDSNGRWRLQEALFRRHFNRPDNTFTTLAQEQLDNPQLFRKDHARLMSARLNRDYHIAFDDEGSYAWTQSVAGNQEYYTPAAGEYQEILTLTNPLLYDIIAVPAQMDPVQADLIASTFIRLAESGADTFGPSVGYNGYRRITDIDQQFYQRMRETMGD